MLSGLLRLVVLRVFGPRVLLALAAVGWLRNRLGGRRRAVDDDARRVETARRRTDTSPRNS